MKKVFLFLTLVASLSSYAQKPKIVSLDETEFSGYASTFMTEANDLIYLSFLDTATLSMIKLNSKLKRELEPQSYIFPNLGYKVVSSLASDNSVSYLLSRKKKELNVLQYDEEEDHWSMGINLLSDNENLLFSMNYKDQFLSVFQSQDSSIIKVYSVGVLDKSLVSEFDLNDFLLNEKSFSSHIKGKKGKIKLIDTFSPFELYATQKSNKAYLFGDQLYLTLEDSLTATTAIVELDLISKNKKIDYLTPEKDMCSSQTILESVMSPNYIVQLQGCKTSADIIIRDRKTKQILSREPLVKNELLNNVCFENLINTDKQALSIEKIKAKSILQRLTQNNASIYVAENEKYFDLIIGNTEDILKNKLEKINKRGKGKGNGSGKSNLSKSGSGSGGGGRKGKKVGMKISFTLNNSVTGIGKSFYKYETQHPKYAVLRYNKSKFEAEVKYDSNKFEKIKTLKSEMKINPTKNELVFKSRNKFWYGYRDLTSNNLLIYKVD